ncbi:sulfite exporter TauE/SafE family protein [Candidatus Uhrbacteria bacterium]|nr:sulfite exporter TauE/SafE family protein [Candidatus Uhrbacteria bacterium]
MELFLITFLTFVAAIVGTVTGFGISTVMLPVLALFLPLPQALLLVGIIHWFGSVWKVVFFREGIDWRLIWLFGLPGVLFSYLGARLVFEISSSTLSFTLGLFLMVYALFLFTHTHFKLSTKNLLTAIIGGGLSGFFAGIFGVGGAIRAAFLSAFDLKKTVFLATAGVIGFVVDSTRLFAYMQDGVRLDPFFLWGLLVFIPTSFLGAYVAKRIVDHIPQNAFRVTVAVFLLLIGFRFAFFA